MQRYDALMGSTRAGCWGGKAFFDLRTIRWCLALLAPVIAVGYGACGSRGVAPGGKGGGGEEGKERGKEEGGAGNPARHASREVLWVVAPCAAHRDRHRDRR